MCSTPKISYSSSTSSTENVAPEIIKTATQADAATQKASVTNRSGARGLVSQNIKTSNNGLDDDVVSSKKKLLGE